MTKFFLWMPRLVANVRRAVWVCAGQGIMCGLLKLRGAEGGGPAQVVGDFVALLAIHELYRHHLILTNAGDLRGDYLEVEILAQVHLAHLLVCGQLLGGALLQDFALKE